VSDESVASVRRALANIERLSVDAREVVKTTKSHNARRMAEAQIFAYAKARAAVLDAMIRPEREPWYRALWRRMV
jgi:hypothetical protein